MTINVTDVPGEAPEKPDTPTVVAASSTSLAVNWVAPDNPGPPITDYDYRYKEPTAAGWTEVTNTAITQTNAIVSPLRPDTSYEVQVRAKNAEANGEWSDSGIGSTNVGGANSAPVFTEGQSTTRTVIPNAQAGEHVGPPVTATDADQGDTVTYSLQGADAASFEIEPQTGQITTRVALSSAQVGDTYTVHGHRKRRDRGGQYYGDDHCYGSFERPAFSAGRTDGDVQCGLGHELGRELGGAGEPGTSHHRLRLPVRGSIELAVQVLDDGGRYTYHGHDGYHREPDHRYHL